MTTPLERWFTYSVNRYFWFGMRHAVRFQAAFAREIALEQAMTYVRHHNLPGDYLEFGVFKGRTFSAAVSLAQERSLNMHFWAFDSFEGLPGSEGEFARGAWKSSLDTFARNVRKRLRDPARLHIVNGWFADSLNDDNLELRNLDKVAIAWVDCDLYESTVPVLRFLTDRLQDGSLIYFDDWFCFRGRSDCGEQRAYYEWVKRNPHLQLTPYWRFGWHGQSFIVHLG